MPNIQRTVFGFLLLVQQSCGVALPDTWAPVPGMLTSTPAHLKKGWSHPYPKDTKCTFPYIWQPSVGICCYPVFNCGPDKGIQFCSQDRGNDSCVMCKDSYKQYHVVHSFDGENATCFYVNQSYEEECIEEETLPARSNNVSICGLPCECNPMNCWHGDDPCRCSKKIQDRCGPNQQMNRLTGACEACPWYSYKLTEGCNACLVNESLWMSGASNVPVPPPTPNVTILVTTTEGKLTMKTDTTTTTEVLAENENETTTQTVLITVGVIVTIVSTTLVAPAVIFCIRRRTICSRSGINTLPLFIAVATHRPTQEDQLDSETSHLIDNITDINLQQSNGYVRQQSVSSNNYHLVDHKVADHMNSPKSTKSSIYLGVQTEINERNHLASSNNESPSNLTETMEETHQNENIDIRNRQENPAEQMETNHDSNNIEPSNNLGITEEEIDMNGSGKQAFLTVTNLVDLQNGSNAMKHVHIPLRTTDDQGKGLNTVNENQNIVHAEVTDPPASFLFASNSNNPCFSSHEMMDKNLDLKIKIELRKDIELPDDSDQTIRFKRGSPVENSHSWSFPRGSIANNGSLTITQTFSRCEDVAQNTVHQAKSTGDVDKRTETNCGKIMAKEFGRVLPLNSFANKVPDVGMLCEECGTYSEDSRIPNEEVRIPSEEGQPQSPQNFTSRLSPTSANNSSPFRPLFNRVLPLSSFANRVPDVGMPNEECGTYREDSRIPNEEVRIPSEEGQPQSPQNFTSPLSPTSASNSSPFRPLFNRSTSSSTDRPTAKVPPMREEIQVQRPDEVTRENSDVSMSTDSSTDISMFCGRVHFHGAASSRDESLESSNLSLNSSCEDNPPSFSYITNSASHTQMENTDPRRQGDLRSAAWNGSRIQMMANQSRGGPDGASAHLHYQENRVREPRYEVFETEVKIPVQSEETDPKTLLSSTQVRDRNEVVSRQDSDSEEDPKKTGLKLVLAEDKVKQIRDICEGLAYLGNPSNAAKNSSDLDQGKMLRKELFAMEANASNKEINLRNVLLHNDQKQHNEWAFSPELEGEENKLNSAAKSRLDIDEISDSSYSSLQDKEDTKKETKHFEDGEKDGGFRNSKSSQEEIKKEANNSISDTGPAVDEISSAQRSSPSENQGVCSNGDAVLNRELQQPNRGHIDLHNEYNSSSLSVNSDESGIYVEKQIQYV